jgi:hypothetical protein
VHKITSLGGDSGFGNATRAEQGISRGTPLLYPSPEYSPSYFMLEHSQHLQTLDSVPVLAIEQLVDRAIQNTNCRVSHSICSHCVLRDYWLLHRSWWLWFHDYVILIRGEPLLLEQIYYTLPLPSQYPHRLMIWGPL